VPGCQAAGLAQESGAGLAQDPESRQAGWPSSPRRRPAAARTTVRDRSSLIAASLQWRAGRSLRGGLRVVVGELLDAGQEFQDAGEGQAGGGTAARHGSLQAHGRGAVRRKLISIPRVRTPPGPGRPTETPWVWPRASRR
jgi:hypothetical protein